MVSAIGDRAGIFMSRRGRRAVNAGVIVLVSNQGNGVRRPHALISLIDALIPIRSIKLHSRWSHDEPTPTSAGCFVYRLGGLIQFLHGYPIW